MVLEGFLKDDFAAMGAILIQSTPSRSNPDPTGNATGTSGKLEPEGPPLEECRESFGISPLHPTQLFFNQCLRLARCVRYNVQETDRARLAATWLFFFFFF
jgi:hypothetical protein